MKYRLLITFFLCLSTGQAHAFPPAVEALLDEQKAKGAVHVFQCGRPRQDAPIQLISCSFYNNRQETGSLLDEERADARIVPKSETGLLYDVWTLTYEHPDVSTKKVRFSAEEKHVIENVGDLSETGSYEESSDDEHAASDIDAMDQLKAIDAASTFTSLDS